MKQVSKLPIESLCLPLKSNVLDIQVYSKVTFSGSLIFKSLSASFIFK